MILEHCYLPTLFSPSAPATFEVAAMLLADSATTTLPTSLHEWTTITMLPGVARYDVEVLLQHKTLAVVVLLSLFPTRLQQASPRLFPVSTPPRPWHIAPVSYVLGQ